MNAPVGKLGKVLQFVTKTEFTINLARYLFQYSHMTGKCQTGGRSKISSVKLEIWLRQNCHSLKLVKTFDL